MKDKNTKDEFMEEIKANIKKIEQEYQTKKLYNYDSDDDDLDILENWLCNHFYFENDYLENYNSQICITIKNTQTGDFRNKFFNYSKLKPKRDSTAPLSYIICNLARIEHYELWIASNMFIGGATPRRTQERVLFSNVLYIDIDKVKGSEDLDWNNPNYNNQLVELLYKNYPVTKYIPPSEIVASGSGLHLYFYINTFHFTSESKSNYTDILRDLTKLYNGDCSCVDIARILRPPSTFNKKGKFTKPKKVELVEQTQEQYTLTNLDNLINRYKKQYGIDIKQKKLKKAKSEKNTQAKQRIKKDYNDNFELNEYIENEDYPKQYLIQDLLFFMKNRNYDCEGVRHNLLFCFYFAFKKYCMMNQETIEININSINKLFVEPLTEKELKDILTELENYNFYNGITNIKVKQMLKLKDEEIPFMKGTYTDNQAEKRNIILDRKRNLSKQKYKYKKPSKTIIITCILNNPEKSDIEIANLLNINRTTVYRHRKDLNK